MVVTILLSFVAGLLTALAPCVLPLLPIILGGSVRTEDHDKRRPYIITGSLVASLILFTILLKASTVLIGIDPRVWSIGSGMLVVILGLFMLMPSLWARLIAGLGIEHRSQSLLGKAYGNKNKTMSAVLTGAALGPVFSSCSPTYAWVLATVLPTNLAAGLFYLVIYCLGVATSLLAIALLGRKLLSRIKWASNPRGWFQRGIALLFILVGIFVATGWDKKVQTYLVDKDFLNLIQLEKKLVPSTVSAKKTSSVDSSAKEKFNVTAYDAPEIVGVDSWLNSDPLTIFSLKGKVVLIDFWTYSCINCQRTQPYLNAWYDKYKNDGLVIIGMHAPEFTFEKVQTNVDRAVKQAKIKYPVALDNNFTTWGAYDNQYWPAKYLIDKDGQVRFTHFGEGEYDVTEKTIQALLKEAGKSVSVGLEPKQSAVSGAGLTPETYLGYKRGSNFFNKDEFVADKPVAYKLAEKLGADQWSLGGEWQMSSEFAQAMQDGAKMGLNFSAKEVYLVMSGPPGSKVTVSVDGTSKPGGADVDSSGQVTLDGPRLYKLVNLDKYQQNKKLNLVFPSGTTINAFTFGG